MYSNTFDQKEEEVFGTFRGTIDSTAYALLG